MRDILFTLTLYTVNWVCAATTNIQPTGQKSS